MTPIDWRVSVGAATTSAAYEPATNGHAADGALFICAHGAGGSMSDRATYAAASEMRRRGLGVVRSDDGAEYPFHCTAIADGTRTIPVGVTVEFAVTAGPLGLVEATQVRRI